MKGPFLKSQWDPPSVPTSKGAISWVVKMHEDWELY